MLTCIIVTFTLCRSL